MSRIEGKCKFVMAEELPLWIRFARRFALVLTAGFQWSCVLRFEVMKASEGWEKEDAMREGIPSNNNRPPKEYVHENGKLKGVHFECVEPVKGENGRLTYVPTGEPDVLIEA